MLHNSVDHQITEEAVVQKEGARPRADLICNDCNVTMVFINQKNQTLRKNVAELIVTAFERQIGVRDTV